MLHRPLRKPHEPDWAYEMRIRPVRGESLWHYSNRMRDMDREIRNTPPSSSSVTLGGILWLLGMFVLLGFAAFLIYIFWPLCALFLLGWVFKDTFFDGGLHPNPWVSTKLRRQHDWIWGGGSGHTSDGAGQGDGA